MTGTHWKFKVVLLEREEARDSVSTTQAGDKKGMMKRLREPIGSQLEKRLTGICRSSNG